MLIKVDFVKMGRAAWQLHLNKAISPSVGRGAFRPDCVFFFMSVCSCASIPVRTSVSLQNEDVFVR